MTSDELRTLIEAQGRGKNISAKVKDISERTGVGEPTLWRYLRQGVPERAPKAITNALARLSRHHRPKATHG